MGNTWRTRTGLMESAERRCPPLVAPIISGFSDCHFAVTREALGNARGGFPAGSRGCPDRRGGDDGGVPSAQAAGRAWLHHRGHDRRALHAALLADPRRGHDQHPRGARRDPADVLARAGVQPAETQVGRRAGPARGAAGDRAAVLGGLRGRSLVRLGRDGPHLPRGDALDVLDDGDHQGALRSWPHEGAVFPAGVRNPDHRGHPRHRHDRVSHFYFNFAFFKVLICFHKIIIRITNKLLLFYISIYSSYIFVQFNIYEFKSYSIIQ